MRDVLSQSTWTGCDGNYSTFGFHCWERCISVLDLIWISCCLCLSGTLLNSYHITASMHTPVSVTDHTWIVLLESGCKASSGWLPKLLWILMWCCSQSSTTYPDTDVYSGDFSCRFWAIIGFLSSILLVCILSRSCLAGHILLEISAALFTVRVDKWL